MFEFQSHDRNLDLADKVSFRNGYFSTTDSGVADFVRRNCVKNPHLLWEITPEVLRSQVKIPLEGDVVPKSIPEESIVPKKRGRPKGVTVVVGARTSDVNQKGE